MDKFKNVQEPDWREEYPEVDALIEYLKSLPCHSTYILNTLRVQEVQFAYAVIAKLLKDIGSDARIECKQHEFNANVAVIRVECDALEFATTKNFSRATELATNLEIYPLTNGYIRMTLTFHGLLIPI